MSPRKTKDLAKSAFGPNQQIVILKLTSMKPAPTFAFHKNLLMAESLHFRGIIERGSYGKWIVIPNTKSETVATFSTWLYRKILEIDEVESLFRPPPVSDIPVASSTARLATPTAKSATSQIKPSAATGDHHAADGIEVTEGTPFNGLEEGDYSSDECDIEGDADHDYSSSDDQSGTEKLPKKPTLQERANEAFQRLLDLYVFSCVHEVPALRRAVMLDWQRLSVAVPVSVPRPVRGDAAGTTGEAAGGGDGQGEAPAMLVLWQLAHQPAPQQPMPMLTGSRALTASPMSGRGGGGSRGAPFGFPVGTTTAGSPGGAYATTPMTATTGSGDDKRDDRMRPPIPLVKEAMERLQGPRTHPLCRWLVADIAASPALHHRRGDAGSGTSTGGAGVTTSLGPPPKLLNALPASTLVEALWECFRVCVEETPGTVAADMAAAATGPARGNAEPMGRDRMRDIFAAAIAPENRRWCDFHEHDSQEELAECERQRCQTGDPDVVLRK